MSLIYKRLCLALFCLLAIGACLTTDLANNDFERLGDLRLTFGFFAIMLGLAAAFVAESARPAGARSVSFADPYFVCICLVLIVTLPVGSRDAYHYLFYGRLWSHYHLNPYLHAPAGQPEDTWFFLLNSWHSRYVMIYGPLFGLHMFLTALCSAGSIWLGLLLLKLANLFCLLSGALCIRRIARLLRSGAAEESGDAAALWLYSPLVLFEGLVNGHNDLATACLILLAVAAWLERRLVASAIWLTCGILYKWYPLILIPSMVLWECKRGGLARLAWRRGAAAVLAAVAVSLVVGAPYLPELPEILAGSAGLDRVRMIFPWEMSPPLWVVFNAFKAAGIFELPNGFEIFTATRMALIVAGIAWLLVRSLKRAYDAELAVRDLCGCLLLFFLFGPSQIWPWHFLPWCALALCPHSRRYRLAVALLSAICLLSYFLTLILSTLLVAIVWGVHLRSQRAATPAGPG